jgi:hypothetical protein
MLRSAIKRQLSLISRRILVRGVAETFDSSSQGALKLFLPAPLRIVFLIAQFTKTLSCFSRWEGEGLGISPLMHRFSTEKLPAS